MPRRVRARARCRAPSGAQAWPPPRFLAGSSLSRTPTVPSVRPPGGALLNPRVESRVDIPARGRSTRMPTRGSAPPAPGRPTLRPMSLFDYLFPLLLIFSVVRQVRGKRLNWFQLAWPLGLVIWAAVKFLHGFPLIGSNLALVVATAVTGCVLGTLAGVFTTVYRRADGALMAKATATTIVLWIAGTVGRLVFGLYAEHGGGPAIASFSHAHGISFAAWGAALILMALCEVAGRTVVLGLRALGGGSRGGGPGGVQEARASSGLGLVRPNGR